MRRAGFANIDFLIVILPNALRLFGASKETVGQGMAWVYSGGIFLAGHLALLGTSLERPERSQALQDWMQNRPRLEAACRACWLLLLPCLYGAIVWTPPTRSI